MTDYKEMIEQLLSDPEMLMSKKPFTRGADVGISSYSGKRTVGITENIEAQLPNYRKHVVPQEQFMRELDPNCHDVLFDDNIPSICVKVNKDDYREVKFEKMAIPFQRIIKDKQLLHLTANPMQFTIMDSNPSKTENDNFVVFKQYWDLRNQDGMKNKMVDKQLSLGDAGLLYYFDYKGRIKSRILSFDEGYVLCPHNDQNGDRILESVYYRNNDIEYIDSYDEKYMYRMSNEEVVVDEKGEETSQWKLLFKKPHGFSEIPLITKRGDVAWNEVQSEINSYEELYNIFNAIQKRFGWGIFYVKGKFKDNAKRIAGSVVLNDTSIDGKGDAKFLTPPSPDGTIETLNLIYESIQLGSSTTFLLPKDVKMNGDVSGIAIMLAQSLDIENALQKVIDWQNVADKMVRLFKEGLAKELVREGINQSAVTEFEDLHVNAKFKVWRPLNEYEFNQMVSSMTGSGLISKETGIEINTLSKPDEKQRIAKQDKEEEKKALNGIKVDKPNPQVVNNNDKLNTIDGKE